MSSILVARARNEGVYQLEWVAHHLNIGFDHILMVTNDLSDGSDAVLEQLNHHPQITWIDVSNLPLDGMTLGQRSYHYASQSPVLRRYDWMMVLDIDEFLVFHKHRNVGDFLKLHDNADVVVCQWKNFGSSGLIDRQPGQSVLYDFIDAIPKNRTKLKEFKSFTRISSLESIGTHYSNLSVESATVNDASGKAIVEQIPSNELSSAIYTNAVKREINYEAAQVNHYAIKSLNEYLFRQDRGDCAERVVGASPKYNLGYFLRRNNVAEQDLIARKYCKANTELVQRLSEEYQLEIASDAVEKHYRDTVEFLTKSDSRYETLLKVVNNDYSDVVVEDVIEKIKAEPQDSFYAELLLMTARKTSIKEEKITLLSFFSEVQGISEKVLFEAASILCRLGATEQAKTMLLVCCQGSVKRIAKNAEKLLESMGE